MSATEVEGTLDKLPEEQIEQVEGVSPKSDAYDPFETDEIILILDGATNTVTVDQATGEVLAVEGAPEDTADIQEILKWVGDRRIFALAKAEGLRAERDVILKRINDQYNPQINHMENFAKWCIIRYFNQLRDFAARALVGKKTKTLKANLLVLKFGTTRERVDLLPGLENDALQYVEEFCADAITIKKSISKTNLKAAVDDAVRRLDALKAEIADIDETSEEFEADTEMQESLADLQAELARMEILADTAKFKEHGVYFYPGGEETFDIK